MSTQKLATLTLRVEDGCKEWNGKPLFTDTTFELFQGEKAALFGKNGVGKTSLLKAIMGETTLDKGLIYHGVPLAEWGWLEQDLQVDPSVSLVAFVKSGNHQLSAIASELAGLERQLEEAPRLDTVDRYAAVQERFQISGGYEWETEVEMSLTKLQLPKGVWETPYQSLSGGQKTRAQLARLMVRKPKVLILDEPTNHLDGDTLRWLEEWLSHYTGTVLFVTHDRTLIDQVADAVIELTPNGCRRYKGGYQSFKASRDLEIRTQTALYE